MYQTLKMTDPDSHNYLALKINLDTYNKILKCSIRLQKKLYYEAYFTKYKSDMRKIWKTIISEIISKRKKKKHFPEFFQNENGLNITDKLEIANTFNDFFVNVGQKLADKLVSKRQKNIY